MILFNYLGTLLQLLLGKVLGLKSFSACRIFAESGVTVQFLRLIGQVRVLPKRDDRLHQDFNRPHLVGGGFTDFLQLRLHQLGSKGHQLYSVVVDVLLEPHADFTLFVRQFLHTAEV